MEPVGRPKESATPLTHACPLVEVGRIVNLHGVRGELRMLPHNPHTAIHETIDAVAVRGPDSAWKWHKVLAARRHKRFILLRLEGFATYDEAEALIGRVVAIARDKLPPAGPGEAYHMDLIGCAVRTEAGEGLGTVRELIATGSNDVLVVEGTDREYLIPLVEDVIARLDAAAAEVVIRVLPGLLDP